MEHPFADGAKLRILNAKYQTPDNPKDVSDLQPLIGMLKYIIEELFLVFFLFLFLWLPYCINRRWSRLFIVLAVSEAIQVI